MPGTVLLVDEDTASLAELRGPLHGTTYRVLAARGARPALEILAIEPVDVVVCAAVLSAGTGVEFLGRVRLRHPQTVRILVSPDDFDAVRQVSPGTVDAILSRPAVANGLAAAIGRALEQLDLMRETQRLLRAVRRQTRRRDVCPPPRLR